MLKLSQAVLFCGILVAHGTYLCCAVSADIQNPEADLESYYEELPAVGQDFREKSGQEFERAVSSENVNQKTVAFFVGLSKSYGPVNEIRDIVFDNIITNVGRGYNVGTGRFKAPVAGTYQFNINVAAQHAKSAAVTVIKNGLTVMIVWSEANPNWAPASNVVILSLKTGDQVWLQVGLHTGASAVYGLMYSTFSGFLIFDN